MHNEIKVQYSPTPLVSCIGSQKVKIKCTDFWPAGDYKNKLFKLLNKYYDLEISDKPDILLYSVFGKEFLKYDCLRVFYTGENVRPDFDLCDYAFSFDYSDDPRNYRLPLYSAYGDVKKLTKPKDVPSIVKVNSKFCNFIYSNPLSLERVRFFELLAEYKRIDSFGKVLNNISEAPEQIKKLYVDGQNKKLYWMAPYKFTIAFENSSYPGYTTEKIYHAFVANTIPIYWGNPLIHLDFNPKSFINCHDYSSFDEVIQRVIEIDQNDALYRQMLAEPCFLNNEVPECVREENILRRLDLIVQQIDKSRPRLKES